MACSDFIGFLNLPNYVVITLLFSYLVWSKFLNHGHLTPKKSDDLFQIGGLFFILFPTFLLLHLIFGFILDSFSMSLDFSKLWNNSTVGVIILDLVLFYWLVIYCTKKRTGKSKLEAILHLTLYSQFAFILILIAGIVDLYWYQFGYLAPLVIAASLVFVLLVLFSRSIVISVFKIESVFRWFKQLWKCVLFVAVILVLILILAMLFSLTIPKIKLNTESVESYELSFENDALIGYASMVVSMNLNTPQFLKIYVPQIPIHYGEYQIATNGTANSHFKILFNTSRSMAPQVFVNSFDELKSYANQPSPKNSFIGARIDESNQLIVLKFNEQTIRSEGINQIILEGYVKKNISELGYSYDDNHKEDTVCDAHNCQLKINISNPLDKPVHQAGMNILHLQNRNLNISRCQFKSVESQHTPRNVRDLDKGCVGDSCWSDIIDEKSQDNIFSMHLYLDKDWQEVKLNQISIEKPMNISLKINITC